MVSRRGITSQLLHHCVYVCQHTGGEAVQDLHEHNNARHQHVMEIRGSVSACNSLMITFYYSGTVGLPLSHTSIKSFCLNTP